MQFVSSFIAVWLLLAIAPVMAQLPATFSPEALGAGITNLFGQSSAFTSVADIQVAEAGAAGMNLTAGLSMLDSKLRVYIDLSKVQVNSKSIPAMVRQMGLDKIVNIMRWDKKVTYEIFPTIGAYIEKPFDNALADAKDLRIEKKAAGSETVDGHPCTKSKLILAQGEKREEIGMTWQATDLKDFPIQMELKGEGDTIKLHFKDIKFTRLDAKHFEPPANFQRYNNIQELTADVLLKRKASPQKPQNK